MNTPLLPLIACAAALAITSPALADLQSPSRPAEPPPPPSGCRPSKTFYCGAGDLTAAQAMQRLARVSGRAGVRRHLTLPTARELFGRRGSWAFATADRALLRSPATASRLRGRAAATGGPVLSRVGSKGGVRVDAGVDHDVGAGLEGSSEKVTYLDRIKGAKATQWRSVTFSASADSCPDPGTLVSTAGDDHGLVFAIERIVTVERRGRFELTTEFTADLTRHKMGAWVNGWAEYRAAGPDERIDVRLQKLRRVRDMRTGRTYRERPLTLKYEVMGIDPIWMYGADNFEAFITRYANDNDDDPADALRSDRLLNHDAFEAVARAFLEAVRVRVRAVYKRAEKVWQTPNRCVEVKADAPDRLMPGQSVTIRPRAVSKQGATTAQLAVDVHTFVPSKTPGLSVDPWSYVKPDPDAGHDFKLTAPPAAWPDSHPEEFGVLFYSKAGVGEYVHSFKADGYPLRYRVLDAHGTLHAKRTVAEGSCSRNYEIDWTLASSPRPGAGPDGLLTQQPGGWVSGSILGGVRLTTSGAHLWRTGDCGSPLDCRYPDMTFDEYIGVDVGYQATSATARLHWARLRPTIGAVNDPDCPLGMSTPEEATLVPDAYIQEIPTSQLTSPRVALTFQRTINYNQAYPYSTHSGTITWDLSLTAERIDENGHAIGG